MITRAGRATTRAVINTGRAIQGAIRTTSQYVKTKFSKLLAKRAPGTTATGQKLLGYIGKLADHYIMPRQFEKFFKARGINIDDFTVSVDHTVTHLKAIHGKGNMGQMPGKWNQKWGDWIDANPNATATDIYKQAGQMMDDFGINHLKIHPYGQ